MTQSPLNFTGDYGTVTVTATATMTDQATQLYLAGSKLVALGVAPEATYTRVVTITVPALEPVYLTRYLADLARAAKLKATLPAPVALPKPQQAACAAAWTALTPLMTLLGVSLTATKKAPAKARHRWTKAIAETPFTTTYAGTQAIVFWQKRNELRVVAGAKLLADAPLNADGSLGFSARFATQLRGEHQAAIGPDFVTTQDIVLKSVNEVGLLLYFAGTNSWLQLKDAAGHTLDELTVVAP